MPLIAGDLIDDATLAAMPYIDDLPPAPLLRVVST